MKSGTFTNNTSFSATVAQVSVPTGTISCTNEYNTITVPNGVTVLKVEIKGDNKFCTVGVTPGKTYSELAGIQELWDDGNNWSASVAREDGDFAYLWAEFGAEGVDIIGATQIDFTLKYSPQINTLKPDYTDY